MKLILLLAIAILASCSSRSGQRPVKPANEKSCKVKCVIGGRLMIANGVDTLFSIGDTIYYPGYSFKVVILANRK